MLNDGAESFLDAITFATSRGSLAAGPSPPAAGTATADAAPHRPHPMTPHSHSQPQPLLPKQQSRRRPPSRPRSSAGGHPRAVSVTVLTAVDSTFLSMAVQ